MKVKLLHHASEWLPGELERPDTLKGNSYEARRIHWHSSGDLIALSLSLCGAGIWKLSGELQHFVPASADLCWDQLSDDLLSLELRRYGRCKQGSGIGHALRRLEATSLRPREEMEICIPLGDVNYLVLNHQSNQCLATWLGHGAEWGYVVVDLTIMKQLSNGLFYPYPTMSPPAYSPDDRHIVSCNPSVHGWWTYDNEEYWETPSPGGSFEVGVITAHDIESNVITNHVVTVDLPEGWMPDKPEAPEWNQIWGPEFVSEREFRFWLPDDSTEILTLPLPPRIEIHRVLGTQRQWLADE